MRTYYFELTDSVLVHIDAESLNSAIYEFTIIFGEFLYKQVQSISVS